MMLIFLSFRSDEVCVLSATGTAAVVRIFDSATNTSAQEDSTKAVRRNSESEQEVGLVVDTYMRLVSSPCKFSTRIGGNK